MLFSTTVLCPHLRRESSPIARPFEGLSSGLKIAVER